MPSTGRAVFRISSPVTPFAAAVVMIALLAALLALGSSPAIHAGPGDVTLVAVDTTIAGNDDSAIGTIDSCASINVRDTLTFDLIIKGVHDADRIAGYQVDVDYDPSVISVTSVLDVDASGSVAPNNVTILSRINSSGGLNFLSLSDWLSTANSMTLSAVDATSSPTPPDNHESGDGVLARVTVTAVGSGVSPLDVGGPSGGQDGFPDVLINKSTSPFETPVTTVQDGAIAVGQPCPEPTPTPLPTPTATPTPTALSPTPQGTGTGGANSLAISPADKDIGVGATASVELVSMPPAESLATWVIDVVFDPAVLGVDSCTPAFSPAGPPNSVFVSACEAADREGGPDEETVVVLGGIIFTDTERGLDDETTLASITFSAVGVIGECSDLTINVVSHLGPDPTGPETNPTTTNGEICIVPSTPTPTLTATPTTTPTPTATSVPTGATPTSTAGPTDSPTAGLVTLVAVDTTTAGNDDSSIGTIDSCASINVGDTLTFDLVIQGVHDADRIGGYQVDIDYDPSVISVTGIIDADAAGSTPPDNVTIISRIASSGGLDFLNFSDAVTNPASMTLSAVDFTAIPAYPDMHESGDGVLARVTVEAVGSGVTSLNVGGPNGGVDGIPDVLINSGTAQGAPVPVAAARDGAIAVGQPCPAPTPTPLPTPTPTATPVPTSTPSATSTPGATGTPPPTSTPAASVSDLRVESATVAPGAATTIAVTADATALGAYRLDVQYDSSLVTAVECTSNHGVCSIDVVAADTVRLNGSNLAGITGNDVVLGTITLLAGSVEGTAALTVDPLTLALSDMAGNPLTATATNGAITIGAGLPSPTPAPCGPLPTNDDIAGATPISSLPFQDQTNTTCATSEPLEPQPCGLIGSTVWYAFTPSSTGALLLDTDGSNFDTVAAAYSGSPGNLLNLGCNDDSGPGLLSRLLLPVTSGETYFFQVGGFAGSGGSLVFTVQEFEPLELVLRVDDDGSVVPREGTATVRGTVDCNKPATVDIYGQLRQKVGRAVISGWFSSFGLQCDGETAWSADVGSDNGLYAGGKAAVEVSAYAYTPAEYDDASVAGPVHLKGSPPTSSRCPRDGNLGFEAGPAASNDIPCWTVVDQGDGSGSWCTQAGTSAPMGPCLGSFAAVEAPPEGSQAAMTGQSGPGSHVLYRCGVLRSSIVSFQLYLNNLNELFFSPASLDPGVWPNQQFRADLVRADAMEADPFTVDAGDVLVNLYQTAPGDAAVSPYHEVAADTSDYAGESVCLRFAEVDNQFYFHAGVDEVAIAFRGGHR